MTASRWLLALAMLAGAAAAQSPPLSPPEGALLVGSPAEVTLRWPDLGSVQLSLTGAQGSLFEGPTEGNSKTFQVDQPGLYRWRAGSGPWHSFQLSTDLELRFPPRGKTRPGLDGPPGASLSVDLEPSGDFVRVILNARELLLVPSSRPLRVWAVGGRGSPGLAGQPGQPGRADANVDSPRYPLVREPGPGGDGGPGGNGGVGGTIRVTGHGVDLSRYFQFHVEGGPGGPGGAGGPGGQALGPVGGAEPRFPAQRSRPGRDGQAGPEGKAGPPGEVIVSGG